MVADAPVILAFEASTDVCSVAVSAGEKVLALTDIYAAQQHARLVVPLAESVLEQVGITFADLSAVATASGPGSYTGLRIAAAAAKGYAQALGIPLLAVPTLEALAWRALPFVAHPFTRIRPLVDARRNEVYTACYQPTENGLVEVAPYEPVVLTEATFQAELAEGPVLFVGDGASKAATLLAPNPQAHFLAVLGCSAASVAPVASRRLALGQVADLATFEPFYGKTVRIGQALPLAQTLPTDHP